MNQLKIDEENIIEYVIERKKIKNYYIYIKDGIVTVKVPTRTSQDKIEELLLKRAEWILKTLSNQNYKKPKQYVEGEIFKVLGKEVELNFVYDKKNKVNFKFSRNKFIVTIPIEYKENSKEIAQKVIDKFYNELAEKEIERAMRKIIMKVGLVPNSYKVKNLKSTWGNCSSSRNISLSKKLVMYSRNAIEYVCLHEICHLKYMNHSKYFWQMVEKYMPDYKKAEEELKR